jgi:amidophosphoribosyltransferase
MISSNNVAPELVFGLNMLQHRGQDAAGVLTFQDRFRLKKGCGLVDQVFSVDNVKNLEGNMGIGHVRYATQGGNNESEAQPFYLNYPFGIGMVHNGNVSNFSEIAKDCREQKKHVVESSNDLELMLYLLANELNKSNTKNWTPHDVFAAVEASQKQLSGAYGSLAVIANRGILAFTDPHGIRPLTMGRRQKEDSWTYAFASESAALEVLGFEIIRELAPGEAVFVNSSGEVHSRVLHQKKPAFCVFEYIYFAREDAIFRNHLVADARTSLGKALATRFREKNLTPDVVIDVPSSAYFFAESLARELGVPYKPGFVKNKYVGRSFIMPTKELRSRAVRMKLNPISSVVKNKRVAVVDDSLVRGTTSERIIQLLREAGAREIYFVSAAPPIKHPCIYGIDMSIRTELLAASLSEEQVGKMIGADAMIYQSVEDMKKVFEDVGICSACFTGEYPTNVGTDELDAVEAERMMRKSGQ